VGNYFLKSIFFLLYLNIYINTGVFNLPEDGFKEFGLQVQKGGDDSESLNAVHSKRTLLMPDYKTQERLDESITEALREGFSRLVLV
jgi:hypothetical protein